MPRRRSALCWVTFPTFTALYFTLLSCLLNCLTYFLLFFLLCYFLCFLPLLSSFSLSYFTYFAALLRLLCALPPVICYIASFACFASLTFRTTSVSSLSTSLTLLTLPFCFANVFWGFVKQLMVDAGSLNTHFNLFWFYRANLTINMSVLKFLYPFRLDNSGSLDWNRERGGMYVWHCRTLLSCNAIKKNEWNPKYESPTGNSMRKVRKNRFESNVMIR